MILERDQWHLGYASLLRDCRGTDHGGGGLTTSTSTATNNTGRTLLLVHPDVDAMCSARILGYMLRADGVPHQLRVCTGWGRLCKILTGMGVIISPPLTEDENGGGGGVMDKVAQHDDDEDYNINNESTATSSTITCDVRAVVLVNMGANRNLAKLFNSFANANSQEGNSSSSSSHKQVRCYVIDSHRPYHLANIHVGKDVVLFNDRPLDEDEIPSDGDDLSGNDDSSSSSSDEDDEEDDNGDGTKRSSTRKNSVWEDVYSDEEEFESDSKAAEDDDEEVVEEENDSDADDESLSMAAAAKRAGLTTKRSRKVGLDYNDDPGDVPLEELQDSDEEDNNDDDEGSRWSKRRRSSQGLNTTTTTANLTTIMDETLEDDDGQQQLASSQTTSSSSTIQKVDYRELRKQRRTRVRLHYSSGSYHASPSSWTAYALCRQLRFGDIPDLLWLACVGLTDAYLHGKLDVAGYSALSINMKQNVGRLFPNDVIDRAGRAVYAEELETTYYQDTNTSNNGGGALTRIGLSENGRILYQDEYKFMLLRHTSLWDSMLHSNFVASKLRVWKSAGRQKLMELLAKIGFPLDQCRQPWAFVGPGMKRRLGERLDDCAEVRTLRDNVDMTTMLVHFVAALFYMFDFLS